MKQHEPALVNSRMLDLIKNTMPLHRQGEDLLIIYKDLL